MHKFKGEKKNKEKYFSNKPFPSFLQVFDLGVFGCYEALHPYLPMKQAKNKQERIKGRGAWSQEKAEKKGEWGMVLSTL